VYGFPYLDTLKLCSRRELCPAGVDFFGRGDERDLAGLTSMLERTKNRTRYCALFTEVPSNPLLGTPDLHRLRELADRHDFCLVVDDTISNFLNVDVLSTGLADAVCTSLTKLVSGRGDVMGGSLVCNPRTERGRWMRRDLRRWPPCAGLLDADALALVRNSTDFVERNAAINETALKLAEWLHGHEHVQTVYYPSLSPSAALYDKVRTGGYGGLLSLTFHPHMCQRNFYDALDVAKGPSLGTNFTLTCPYTLLAHYHELDFAMNYSVPPNLLRVAVGLEPFDVLQGKFEEAFRTSRLYPKPSMSTPPTEQRRAYSTVTEAGRLWVGQSGVRPNSRRTTRGLHQTFRRVATFVR
jgi:cystathionine gamma-synthase